MNLYDPKPFEQIPGQMAMSTDSLAQADALELKADTLRLSLLAPSMREDALRAEAKRLRDS